MSNQTNIVTEKVAQYKLLEVNKKIDIDFLGEKIKFFFKKNVINEELSNLYLKILSNQAYGQYGYSEDKKLNSNNNAFKIIDFYFENDSLIFCLDILNNNYGDMIRSFDKDNLKLQFSAFMEIKNGFNPKKLNKVLKIEFLSFYLVNK